MLFHKCPIAKKLLPDFGVLVWCDQKMYAQISGKISLLLQHYCKYMQQMLHVIAIGFALTVLSFPSIAQTGPFSITGHVITPVDKPVIDATVIVDRHTVLTTDTHGDFIAKELAAGIHLIEVVHLGFDSLQTSVNIDSKNTHVDIILRQRDLELQEVVIIGDHYNTGRVEQAQTVITVDANDIVRQNAGTLINSMSNIPGINAINTGVGIAKPVIRGMSFNRVLVMDKGIKQEGQQWGADHGLEIDQYDPERIEIVKGPSSLLFGSDAIGGAIRILPHTVKNETHLEGDILTTYKSNNDLFGVSASVRGSKAGRFFRLRMSAQDFGDYRVPADQFTYNSFVLPIYGGRLKNTAGNERNISISGGLRKNWGTTSVTFSNFHQKAGLFPGATGIPREYTLAEDGKMRNIDYPRQVTNHMKMISNTVLYAGKNWLEIDIGYQYNKRKEEGTPHAHGYAPTPDGNLALGLDLQTLSTNIRFNTSFSEAWTAVVGAQGQYQYNRFSGFEFLLPEFAASNAGTYLYTEFSPSHLFTLSSGLRYDYGVRDIKAHFEPDYTTPVEGDSTLRNPAIKRDFHDLSAAIGISYYPSVRFNTKLNIGSSFRMPTPAELASNGVHHGTFRHERGDSSLDSERGIQGDINFTYQDKKFNVLVTPFAGYFHNYIYLAPQAEFSPLPGGGLLYQYTQHDAVFTGFESTAEYTFAEHWKFETGVEYVWNKNLDTRLPLPFTPPFSVFGRLHYRRNLNRRFAEYLDVSLQYHLYAAQKRVDRNEAPTDGYGLTNLSTSLHIPVGGHTVQVLASVVNVFDVYYMNHLSRYRLLNLPEQGRNFMLSLKVPFKIK
jgi:iron complex outermembrane receptor protein